MKRIGVLLWSVAWALFYYQGALPNSGREWLWIALGVSLVAAFGRVAEWVYVGGALWPVIFPAYAVGLAQAVVWIATAGQVGFWGFRLASRGWGALQTRKDRREAWLYREDEEPVFTRSGEPVNQAAWRELTPEAFEEEVLELFRSHGFTGSLTPLSGDEGIDLDLHHEGCYAVAQCKHYLKPVGQAALRDFAGAMRAVGADYGYFITTSSFTDPAERWARSLKDPYIVLVDGPALIRWAQEGCLPC